jgi:hypothetical protein
MEESNCRLGLLHEGNAMRIIISQAMPHKHYSPRVTMHLERASSLSQLFALAFAVSRILGKSWWNF